jgi:hypothetical protein
MAAILGVSGPALRLAVRYQGAGAMTATSRPRTSGYGDVVDLDRYPVNAPASPAYRALVRACRDQLRSRGVAQLAGFLTPAAVSQMLALASQLAAGAWASDQAHTVYFEPADDSQGPDHPRALLQHSAKKAIGYDQIPAGAPIRRLYESDDLTAFIAAVLGKPVLYRSADPLDALEIAVFSDGDELGWHFDNSEFGGFNRWSQHLDHGGVRWGRAGSRCRGRPRVHAGSGQRIGRCGRRCVHLAGLSPHVRCNGSSGG